MSKKKFENSLLTFVGAGLLVTLAVILLKTSREPDPHFANVANDVFPGYVPEDHGLHVFSETGILL